MSHDVLTCKPWIEERIERQDTTTLLRVVCVHGHDAYIGPPVEERGWHPGRPAQRGCAICDITLPKGRLRYCSDRCYRAGQRETSAAYVQASRVTA